MTVYVDDALKQGTVGRLTTRWSHLLADTDAELFVFAKLLGLRSEWLRLAGTPAVHYVVSEQARARAFRAGAKPVTFAAAGQIVAGKRAAAEPVGQILDDLAAGRVSVDEAAADFAARTWPRLPATTDAQAWGVVDDPAPAPDSWTIVNADSRLSPTDYQTLAAAYQSAVPGEADGPPPEERKIPRWNPQTRRHAWIKVREHWSRCAHCDLTSENELQAGGVWFRWWHWPDGAVTAEVRTPSCPGPVADPPGGPSR
jgi:hypothetical protein